MTSRKGRLSPLTAAYATDITTLPTANPHQLRYYSESFAPTEGFVNDQEIVHGAANGRDMSLPAPSLKRASGGLQVPMDFSLLGFFLPMLCGPAATAVEDAGVSPSKWTRTFTSGLDTQQLAAFSIPATDDRWKVVHNAYLNSLSFSIAKTDGYRTMDLGFLTPDVTLENAQPTFAGAGSPVVYTPEKAPGDLGTFSIDGVVLADLIDGTFSFSNQGELIDLVDGTDKSLGQESGDTLIRTDLTMRVKNGLAVNDVIDNFQGAKGTPFAAQFNFPLNANASLVIDLPNCVGERRFPVVGSAERQTFQAPLQAFQNGGSPAATFTIINQVQ